MIEIQLATVGTETGKRLALANAHFCREFLFGSTWNVIRLGTRIAFSSATNVGTPEFLLGLMTAPVYDSVQGLTNGPYEWPTHFVGLQTSAATWTPAGSPASFSINTSTLKRIGNTDTNGANIGTWIVSAAPTLRRTPLIVEITKATPNFTIQPVYSGTTLFDCSKSTYLAALEAPTLADAATLLGNGTAVKAAQTVAVDEVTSGSLVSMVIAWARTKSTCYFSDAHFCRMS